MKRTAKKAVKGKNSKARTNNGQETPVEAIVELLGGLVELIAALFEIAIEVGAALFEHRKTPPTPS